MAVPIHGSHRAGHFLRRRRGALLALAPFALVPLAGCAPDAAAPAAPAATAATAAMPTDDPATPATGAGATVAAAAALFAPAPARGPAEPAFPDDLGSHAGMPFESRSWYIVLSRPDGSVRAMRQRFDRVALLTAARTDTAVVSAVLPVAKAGAADAGAPAGRSAWRFDTLMQASGARATLAAGSGDIAATAGWQQVQRVALELAGSDPDGASGVLGHRLEVSRDPHGCTGRYRLDGPGTGPVEVVQQRCPAGEVVASTARAGSGAMLALSDGGARGVAWQQHVWGAVPAGEPGAVRFDVATLTLRGVGTLELVRSRRSSGRGTPVVTARLMGDGGWQPVEGASWPLEANDDGAPEGGDRAGVERMRIASLGVDVALSRLALPGEAGPLPDPVAWRGVLFAHGTHTGAGFAELAPVEVSDDDA